MITKADDKSIEGKKLSIQVYGKVGLGLKPGLDVGMKVDDDAVVTEVAEGGLADKEGVQAGDVVYECADCAIGCEFDIPSAAGSVGDDDPSLYCLTRPNK